MRAAFRSVLNFLLTVVSVMVGYVLFKLFGLIGIGALLLAVIIYGYLTRKPQQPTPKGAKQPNPWINK